MEDAARSPLVQKIYLIQKYSNYKFHEILEMPYLLKELLYHAILYEHGTKEQDDGFEDGVFNIDDASPDQIKKILGVYEE